MKLPPGILFDHDGVLVASEPMHWRAWARLAQEIGIPYDESIVRGAVGKTAPEILETMLAKFQPDQPLGPDDLRTLVDRKSELYREEAARGIQAFPGVPEGLAWLKKAGVRMGVVSNARRRELLEVLSSVGLLSFFEFVLSREDVTAFKPDPTPYLTAAGRLGLGVSECLAVEDSPPGIESALVARMPAAAVLTNFPEAIMQAPVPGRPDLKPVCIARSMEELFERLRAMER